MKTRHTLLYMLTVVLALLGIQTVQAQQTQDALYIYRNDGQFIAFFYGDIDHIEYSKVDTLGVEQPDYVVQEVYALDSVFRIPISAIDSVAFVTPETKIKADVFCPDKTIADYIVASDSVYWIRLALNTPATLIPKVGAKLLIEEESKYIPDGFGGLVTDVTEGSDGYTVMTKGLKLTDIYDQLVVKVAGASPGMQPMQSRRDAGLDGVDIEVPETEIPIPTVSGTLSLKKSQALLPDNSYAELNGEVQGSLSTTVATKLRLRAFLTITPFTGMRYYQETFITTEEENAATLTGGLSGRIEAPLLPSPIHTFKKGKLKIELGVGLFLEAQATALTLTLKNSKTETTRINTTMEQDDIAVVGGVPVFNPYHRWSTVIEKDTNEMEISTTGQYSIGFGAFAKAETKFSIPIEKTPKFVQAFSKSDTLGFKATLGLDVGTKLEYTGPLSTGDAENLLETVPIYTSLNQGNVALSAYLKFVAGLSCCGWGSEYAPEVKFWEPINRGLVPEIKSVHVMENPETPYRPYRLLMTATTGNRKVLTGNNVGFAIFENQQKLVADSISAFYWVNKDAEDWVWRGSTNRYECVFELDPIKDDYRNLTVYPMVELWGKKMLADQSFDFKLDPARIDVEQREVFIGRDMGSLEMEVVPNMKNMEVKAEADWLKQIGPSWLDHKNQLTIYWPDLPADVKDRRGVIRLTGKSKEGEVLVEDSIVVVQYEPFIELTPTKLEFDAKGGTKEVTIGETNLKDLSVSTESDFCKVTFKDNVITVTVGENTSAEERLGSVVIKGIDYVDKEISTFFEVSQAAGSGTTPVVTNPIIKKAFCGKWRKLDDDNNAITTLIINEDLTYEQKSVCIEEYTVGFDHYEKGEVIGNIMFGKFEFWNPDNWIEMPKEYLPDDLKGYDKCYYLGYKQVDRTVAERTYGKWLSPASSTTMNGVFEISPDYKYMVENSRYYWVKMDENDPLYPEPYMNYADPANLFLSDSVAYESNLRTEPEMMKYDRFWVSAERRFLKNIQATPDENFIHIESISEDGTIYYSFDENTTIKKREGHINVQGTWPDGSIGKAVFTIRQHGGRTLENLSKIYVSGGGKATKTVVKKYVKGDTTTETTESSISPGLTATSFTVNAAGSGVKIEASNKSRGEKVTFTLSEGFKKSSKANDIVYSRDSTRTAMGMTEVYQASMKASNVPCYSDSGDKMTIKGKLSDGVSISEVNYLHYWEDDKPEDHSSGYQWYFSESYEYVSDPENSVNIEITWKTEKWER